jgi:hypothetical protein
MRPAPPGWVRALTPEEVIEWLRRGEVSNLSLDHDLGLHGSTERTGYTVLLWLEKQLGDGRWAHPLPQLSVHSTNPVGRKRMFAAIRTIQRLAELTPVADAENGQRGVDLDALCRDRRPQAHMGRGSKQKRDRTACRSSWSCAR